MLRLQAASLDWALAHVERFGDTDVFPLPFEYAAIRHDWNDVRAVLEAVNVLQWNTRPLRMITLADVDEGLLAAGIDFIRFNDDYRIFASSYEEGYRAIMFLAELLFRNHGLNLQPQKTEVLTAHQFSERFLVTPLDREMNSLHERFEELVQQLALDNWYDEIDYDELDDDQKEIVDSLNLAELFREELEEDEPGLPLVRFVLRRLSQLGDAGLVDDIFDNLDKLHPALPDICRYIRSLRYLNADDRSALGARMLDLLSGSVVSELAYHRMWILDLFVHSREWDNESRFFTMYGGESDSACRRNLILAMGRAHHAHWFQSQWRTLFDQPHWPRRALLAGASCMSADARRHWYRSVEPQLDVLERAVVRWAIQNPF